MKKIYFERYKHGIPLIVYAVIYCVWFAWLERTVNICYSILFMVFVCVRRCFVLFLQKQTGILENLCISVYRNDCVSGNFHSLAQRTSSPPFGNAQRKHIDCYGHPFVPCGYSY